MTDQGISKRSHHFLSGVFLFRTTLKKWAQYENNNVKRQKMGWDLNWEILNEHAT